MAGILDTIRSRSSNDPVSQYIIDTYRGAGGLLSDIAQSPQVQYFAGQFAPGAGSVDFSGQMPLAPTGGQSLMDVYAAPDRLPSFRQNVSQGNYLDSALQALGATGDLAQAIPGVGAVLGTALKAPRAIQRTIKASKSASDLPQTQGLLDAGVKPKDAAKKLLDKKAVIDAFAKKSPKAFARILKKTGKKDTDRIYAAVRSRQAGQEKARLDYANAKKRRNTSLFFPGITQTELRLEQMGFKRKGSSVSKPFNDVRSVSSYWEHPATGKRVRVSDHPPAYARSMANHVFIHPGSFKSQQELDRMLKGLLEK
jgi:hypothetical protein